MNFFESTENEDLIVTAGYEIANKLYNKYAPQLASLNIEKEDYLQDAVMYTLNLYQKGYFEIKEDLKPHGIIYNLLTTFTKNQFQIVSKKNKRFAQSLDNPIASEDGEEKSAASTLMQTQFLTPEEYTMQAKEIESGKKHLQKIVNTFSVTPFSKSKHTYKGTYHKELGRNFKFSEKNIGVLLMHGATRADILRAYNVYTSNIGTDSKATVVNRKAKYVMAKIGEEIKKLPEEAQKQIKTFILSR